MNTPSKRFGPRLLTLIVAFAVGGLGAVPGVTVSAQDTVKSTNDGVYTSEQADRGRDVFQSRCGTCHEADRFTGPVFLESWTGQPLHALFDLTLGTMPEDNPGSLRSQQYADVLSFLLELNGFPPGDEELEGTSEAMKAIRMDAPTDERGEKPVPGKPD